MRRALICLTACLITLTLFSAPIAEESPVPPLSFPDTGTVHVSFVSVDMADDRSATLLNDFFSGMSIAIDYSEESSFGTMTWGGARITIDEGFALSSSVSYGLLDIGHTVDLIKKSLSALYLYLDGTAGNIRDYRDSISVRYVASSSRIRQYTLSEEETAVCRQAFSDIVKSEPLMEVLLDRLAAGTGFDWNEMAFIGTCRLRRLFDRDDREFGVTFSGKAAFGDETEYKVSFTAGHLSEKGGYYSLDLTRSKGTGQFKSDGGWKLTQKSSQKTIDLSFTGTEKSAGSSDSVSLKGSLSAGQSDPAVLRGTISASRNKDGLRTVLNTAVDASRSGDVVSGIVTFDRTLAGSEKSGLQLAFEVTGNAAPAQRRETDPALQTASVYREIVGRMKDLTEEDRTLLTHLLRTNAWMTMESFEDPQYNLIDTDD